MLVGPLFVSMVLASSPPVLVGGMVAASSFVAVAVASANDGLHEPSDEADPDARGPQCEMRLELPATIDSETTFVRKIEIKNSGKTDVTLVLPGDGSDCRWRTPVVGWSLLSADTEEPHPKEPPRRGGGRCGNINPLKPTEVFTLKSGESKELAEWTGFPSHLAPGRYRVVFYYSNVPNLKWSGIPLGKHDNDAMRRLKSSTPITLVSNEVEIEITE